MRIPPPLRPVPLLLLLLLGLGASALAARPALAATTLVIQRGTREPATVYADGNHMRAGISGSDQVTAVIMDGAARKLTMVNDRDKTFMVITEEEMKRMQAKVADARAQVEEKIKNLPPEQRKRAEEMLKGMPGGAAARPGKPAEWKFEALGQKKTVNGMPCETYRVLLDGTLHEEDCILPWSSKLLKRSDFAGLEKLGQTMSDSAGVAQGGGIPLLNKYPGLPISRVVIGADGTRGEEEQIKSVKQGPVPPGSFAVPPGYTKKPLPAEIGGPGH